MHSFVTSFWTDPGHVITLFAANTVTTACVTLLAVCLPVTFCNNLQIIVSILLHHLLKIYIPFLCYLPQTNRGLKSNSGPLSFQIWPRIKMILNATKPIANVDPMQ